MLKLEDIFVVFHAGTPLEKIALRGINFEVEEGEIVTLVGNNGCGKTTLLKLLAGHIYSNFGKIWLDKRDISCQSLSDRAQFFSFVSSAINIGIAMNLTVAENLALANIHHQTGNILTPAINSETYEAYYEQLKELDFMAIEAVLDEKASDISFIHKQMLALLIAFSILDLGIFSLLAFSITILREELFTGSGSPLLAATYISLASLANTFPLSASIAPFFLLIVDHLLCPDIISPLS